jgi:tripartite-type tricarboxylate transporter receptor subunit TctC
MKLDLIKTLLVLCLTLTFGAHAQPADYPAKPIRFVVAFAAGGIADTMARLVGCKLLVKLGQAVVVDNRGGAGGNSAAKLVAGAEPAESTPDQFSRFITDELSKWNELELALARKKSVTTDLLK